MADEFPTVTLDKNPQVDTSKLSAWDKLTQGAKDIGMSTEQQHPSVFDLKDAMGKVREYVGDKIYKGVDWLKKNADNPILPAPPPPRTYVPGFNPETGTMLTPAEIGMRTFFDQASSRLYDKVLRPLSTPKNVALGAGMAVAPEAAIPYLTTAMATPMAVQGFEKAMAAQKETDPDKRMEMFSDAALSVGMATVIGAKGGRELINRVGEVPIVNAIKDHVANSNLITDEDGYVSKDFLDSVDRYVNADRKHPMSVPKLFRGLDINDPALLLSDIRSTEIPVRIDPSGRGASYFDPRAKLIKTSPNLQTFWHEQAHFKNLLDNNQIFPDMANNLVNSYISDHFLTDNSKAMQRIGEGILKDFNDPQIARKKPGLREAGTSGELRQELVAEAYAWDRSKVHFGEETAQKFFRPNSTISYTLHSDGAGAAAMRGALKNQQLKYRLDSEIANNKQVLGNLKEQGLQDSPDALSAQNKLDTLKSTKLVKQKLVEQTLPKPSTLQPAPTAAPSYLPAPPEPGQSLNVSYDEPPSIKKPSVYESLPGRASYDVDEGRWLDSKDNPIPDHLQGVRSDLVEMKYHPNPEANTWAIGKDSKNRMQYVFNPKYVQSNQAARFSNISEMNTQIGKMTRAINKDFRGGDNQEEAAVMKLITETGIRIGGKKTLADKQSYGATTLEGGHVVGDDPKNVRLQFTGKSGKDWDMKVTNKEQAQDLLKRRDAAGPDGKIFRTNADKVRVYSKSLGTGDFTPKDHRTYIGTDTALTAIKKMEPPKTIAQYKRAVSDVGDIVADRLNNTRAVAIKNYIDPTVWTEWKNGISQEGK